MGVDIFHLVINRFPLFLTISVFLLIVFKVLLLHVFYRNSPGASRTRKYIDRRMRLFLIPWFQPRRIMRDVRGRMLAIGWLQLVAVMLYLVLSLVVYFYLDAVTFSLYSKSSSILPFYLILKSGVLLGILYDTDLTLCLWYFGCLGCAVNYVRSHINRKRVALDGWPLAFSFSVVRFYILCFFKLLDFLWGVYGWFLVTRVLVGSKFVSIPDAMQVLIIVIGFSLVFSDLWIILLLMGVRWLFKRRRVMKKIGMLEVSDDSEIDEFNLKVDLEEYQRDEEVAEVVNEIHRKLYLLRMKQETIRLAEKTENSRPQSKGHPKLPNSTQNSAHPSENSPVHGMPENPYRRDSRDSRIRSSEEHDLGNRVLLHAVEDTVLAWSDYFISLSDGWWKSSQQVGGNAPVAAHNGAVPFNVKTSALSEQWTRLQDTATLKMSTVLIDIDAAAMRGRRSTFGGSKSDTLQALVLEQLVQHVSTKGYQVVESGINEYGAIRLHCWTTEKQGERAQPAMLLHSPQSDIQLVPDPCLVELKLFPGALIDGVSAGSMRQSFLMETDLRCEQKTEGTINSTVSIDRTYRGMALDELFYFID